MVLLLGAMLVPLAAQDASGQPPTPRINAAPDHSAWTLTFKYKQPDAYPKTSNPVDAAAYAAMRKAHPRLVTIEVVKAGDRREEIEHYADGTATTRWVVGNIMTTDFRATHRLETLTSGQTQVNFQDEFEGLAWIKKARYLGRQPANVIDCHAYQGAAPDSGEETIYINAKTGLPQQIETADATITYTFADSTDSLPLPAAIEQRIKAFRATLVHGGV